MENLRTPPSNNAVRFDAPPSYPDIVWIDSIDEARARAADEHKPMIIFVRAAWSKASVDMESTIWRDDRILALAQARAVDVRFVGILPREETLAWTAKIAVACRCARGRRVPARPRTRRDAPRG